MRARSALPPAAALTASALPALRLGMARVHRNADGAALVAAHAHVPDGAGTAVELHAEAELKPDSAGCTGHCRQARLLRLACLRVYVPVVRCALPPRIGHCRGLAKE